MAKAKQNVIEKAARRRDAIAKGKHTPRALTNVQCERIVQMLEEGATLSECFTIRGMASYGAFYAKRSIDPEFDARVRKAMAQGAEAAIAEASELSRAASKSDNPDDMKIAESFHRCALGYAEKVAPKEYGQLVKLGNADGGPLSVNVVSYALPELQGKFREITDASHAHGEKSLAATHDD